MIRMQTRTWNNLIIFVMLGMLVLFFVLNQKINTSPDIPAQLLIPHEMQLTRWQSAGIDLQRNSQGGFTETNSNQISETAINRLLAAWESAVISSEPLSSEQIVEMSFTEAHPPLPVVITAVDYVNETREIAINVIRLPQQT